MNKTSERNYILDALRFLFGMMIVIHHSYVFTGGQFVYAPSGYIGVEFFFLVTGFYMMSSIESKTCLSDVGVETRQFVLNKIMKILPYYILSIIVADVVKCNLVPGMTVKDTVLWSVTELLMLQMAGFAGVWPTGAAWYLSALFLSLLVLYPIARTKKSLYINVIAPLIAIMGLGYITRIYTSIGSEPGIWSEFLAKGMIRALAEISLGAVLFYIAKGVPKKVSLPGSIGLAVLELLSYVGVAYIAYKHQPGGMDFFAILCLCIGIVITTSQKSILHRFFNFKFFGFWGKISMVLFLNNYYWSGVMDRLFPHVTDLEKLAWYCGISVGTSVVIYLLGNTLTKVVRFCGKRICNKGE